MKDMYINWQGKEFFLLAIPPFNHKKNEKYNIKKEEEKERFEDGISFFVFFPSLYRNAWNSASLEKKSLIANVCTTQGGIK